MSKKPGKTRTWQPIMTPTTLAHTITQSPGVTSNADRNYDSPPSPTLNLQPVQTSSADPRPTKAWALWEDPRSDTLNHVQLMYLFDIWNTVLCALASEFLYLSLVLFSHHGTHAPAGIYVRQPQPTRRQCFFQTRISHATKFRNVARTGRKWSSSTTAC